MCVIGFQWYIHDEILMPSLIRFYRTNSDQAHQDLGPNDREGCHYSYISCINKTEIEVPNCPL